MKKIFKPFITMTMLVMTVLLLSVTAWAAGDTVTHYHPDNDTEITVSGVTAQNEMDIQRFIADNDLMMLDVVSDWLIDFNGDIDVYTCSSPVKVELTQGQVLYYAWEALSFAEYNDWSQNEWNPNAIKIEDFDALVHEEGSHFIFRIPGVYVVYYYAFDAPGDYDAFVVIVDGDKKEAVAAAKEPVVINGSFIATTDVNVRASASPESAAIGYIPRGARPEVLEVVNDYWLKIQYNENRTGYVSRFYVVEQQSIDTTFATVKTVNTQVLNVRKGAGVSHSIIGVVLGDETVYVLESLQNGWAKIAFNGFTGYVYEAYLK